MIAATLLCLVVGVSDGDTITARCGEPGAYEQVKVRIQGIDAPERKQAFGNRARQAMSDLVFQRWADLRCGKTDRYRRKVCSVWVAPASAPNGPRTLDAGLAMVSQGMAWWYRAYSRQQTLQDSAEYAAAEEEAQAMRLGLWAQENTLPPWAWRAEAKK